LVTAIEEGKQGRDVDRVDQTRLESGEHIRFGQWDHLKTQRLAQLLRLRIPHRGPQSELAEIIRRAHRHFGKEIDPPSLSPA
jgi:hypothetical protein